MLDLLRAERGLPPIHHWKPKTPPKMGRLRWEAKERIFLRVLLDLYPECAEGTKTEFTGKEIRVALVEYGKRFKIIQGDDIPKARFTGKVGARRKRIV